MKCTLRCGAFFIMKPNQTLFKIRERLFIFNFLYFCFVHKSDLFIMYIYDLISSNIKNKNFVFLTVGFFIPGNFVITPKLFGLKYSNLKYTLYHSYWQAFILHVHNTIVNFTCTSTFFSLKRILCIYTRLQ